jgi:flagellar motor switch/type III secretory pathway protein FliN
MSTEFSDEEMNDLYRRFKIMQDHQKQTILEKEDADSLHEAITRRQSQGQIEDDDNDKLSKFNEFLLTEKVLNDRRVHIVSSINAKIAEMRLIHDLRKMNIGDLVIKDELKDTRLDEAFTPFQAIVDTMLHDEDLPQEVRKFFT